MFSKKKNESKYKYRIYLIGILGSYETNQYEVIDGILHFETIVKYCSGEEKVEKVTTNAYSIFEVKQE